MADASEDAAGLPDGAIRLKWPNDLVVETSGPGAPLVAEMDPQAARALLAGPIELRKLGGVLGETDGLGTQDPRAVVGIGLNADWPEDAFPPELAPSMTSLRVASGGRPVDPTLLLDGFLARLEPRVEALRLGRFAMDDWIGRQATTGRMVRLSGTGEAHTEDARALGVDPGSGGLVIADDSAPGGERIVLAADVDRVRVVGATPPAAAGPGV